MTSPIIAKTTVESVTLFWQMERNRRVMPLNTASLVTFTLLFCAGLCSPVYAQNNPPPRGIPSDDFANSRPETAATGAAPKLQQPSAKGAKSKSSSSTRRKETYKLVRIESKAFRPKAGAKPPSKVASDAKLHVEELGVTFWRLRPARVTDGGPKITVKTDDNRREWWTPVRVGADTQFHKGDRVRLTFESRRRGYLYVMNAEMYGNGGLGKLFLIFPAPIRHDGDVSWLTAGPFNQVGAGLLVDIPDQAEDFPYFKIEPRSPNYAGELLLLILSPTPLEGLRLGPDQEVLNVDLVTRLEETWGAEASLYTKEGSKEEAFTSVEQQAQCGAKSRQFVRETPPSQNSVTLPCGDRKRQLTREDPLPQSIYRVSTFPDGLLIVPVRIAVSTP